MQCSGGQRKDGTHACVAYYDDTLPHAPLHAAHVCADQHQCIQRQSHSLHPSAVLSMPAEASMGVHCRARRCLRHVCAHCLCMRAAWWTRKISSTQLRQPSRRFPKACPALAASWRASCGPCATFESSWAWRCGWATITVLWCCMCHVDRCGGAVLERAACGAGPGGLACMLPHGPSSPATAPAASAQLRQRGWAKCCSQRCTSHAQGLWLREAAMPCNMAVPLTHTLLG